MNLPVHGIRGAVSPVQVLNALHCYFAREVMETASWDTVSEEVVKKKRYQLALRALSDFLEQTAPVTGDICVADWILNQLGSLPIAIVTPDDPIRLWRALRILAERRKDRPAQDGPCWQLSVDLPFVRR